MKFVVIMSLSLAGLATALVAYTSACNSS